MSDAREIPLALERSLGSLRRDIEVLVRRRTWTEGTIYWVGDGPGLFAALRGALALETFLHRPALVRTTTEFENYSIPAIEPRSLAIFIASPSASEWIQRLGSQMESRAATLWVVTGGPLVRLCNWKDVGAEGERAAQDLPSLYCQNVLISTFAVIAAQILRGSGRDDLAGHERDISKLPSLLETTLSQLSDAAKGLSLKIHEAKQARVFGGGFYYPTALHAAWRLLSETAIGASAENIGDPLVPLRAAASAAAVAIILSGSQCLLRERAKEAARALRKAHASVISISDPADRDLELRSEMAILLPPANEAIGSLVALAMLESVGGRLKRLERASKT